MAPIPIAPAPNRARHSSAVLQARLGPRTLGVDYGLRRVGLAVSVGIAPRALPRVEHNRDARVAARAVARAASDAVCHDIVVGMPVDAQGRHGEQAVATHAFVVELAAAAPWARVLTLGERYTSAQARDNLAAAGVARRHVAAFVDGAAAVVLLQRFFADGDEEKAAVFYEPEGSVAAPKERGNAPADGTASEEVAGFREWRRRAMERAKETTKVRPRRKKR